MGVTVRELSPASKEPITLDQAKQHLNELENDFDQTIEANIVVARRWVERRTSLKLRAVEVDLTLDFFPAVIELPFAPVSSITEIKFFNGLGVEEVLPVAEFQSDLIGRPHRICPVFGSTWPVTETRLNAVTVTFVAGHDSNEPVPEDIIHGMKMLIAHWDRNREAVVIGTISKAIEFAVDSLVLPYRVPFV